MKRIAALALALFLAAPAIAHQKPLSIGQPYAEARAGLVASGWVAQSFPQDTAEFRCSYRTEICTTFPEAEMCYGTGIGACGFVFERADGIILRIWTVGEEVEDLTVDVVEIHGS